MYQTINVLKQLHKIIFIITKKEKRKKKKEKRKKKKEEECSICFNGKPCA